MVEPQQIKHKIIKLKLFEPQKVELLHKGWPGNHIVQTLRLTLQHTYVLMSTSHYHPTLPVEHMITHHYNVTLRSVVNTMSIIHHHATCQSIIQVSVVIV